jgi:hypothetical protein
VEVVWTVRVKTLTMAASQTVAPSTILDSRAARPMSTSLLDEILKGEEVLATGRRAPCLRAPHSAASSHARLLRSLVTGRSLPQALPCSLLHEGRHLAMLDPTARQPELPVRAHRPR